MKAFTVYTLARVGLFLVAFGLIWLVGFSWVRWDQVSAFFTAMLAMVVSSVAAWFVLGPLRARLAGEVSRRADRAKAAFESRRSAEDRD